MLQIIRNQLAEIINNIDDLYQKSRNVTLTKIIRYVCLVLTVMVPAFYLSLITFDQESIPTDLLISFSTQREGVPFPAFVEAAAMIFSFEILYIIMPSLYCHTAQGRLSQMKRADLLRRRFHQPDIRRKVR